MKLTTDDLTDCFPCRRKICVGNYIFLNTKKISLKKERERLGGGSNKMKEARSNLKATWQ